MKLDNVILRGVFCFSLLLIVAYTTKAQEESYTVSGYVQKKGSGEKLIGANILEKQSQNGTTTNEYGYFSLQIPEQQAVLRISYVGHRTIFDTLNLDGDKEVTYKMDTGINLDGVTVTAEKSIQEESQMSKIEMQMDQVESMPKLMGETDVMRTTKLMPGVQSGTESTSGLMVRGGSPNQNLILLDGVPLYHASHLGGFFSVFNDDAVKSMEVIKGGFPARYGNRLSSVVDIRMKDGNMNQLQGEGSVGLLSSKLMLEGPIVEDKTSFMISGRRSYFDLLMDLFDINIRDEGSARYHFYDINAKVNHTFSDEDRIYLSFYNGDDKVSLDNDFGKDGKVRNTNAWGNLMGSIRWNHVFNQDLFANFTANYTRYRLKSDIEQTSEGGVRRQNYESNVKDWFLKGDFDWNAGKNHDVRFGAKATYHTFTPGVVELESETEFSNLDTTFGADQVSNYQFNAYIQDKMDITSKLKANIGLHSSIFTLENDAYYSLQPRLSARYLINDQSSVKASYASMRQYVHVLSNSSASLPTDLWVPSTDEVPPQQSRQIATGYSRTLFDGNYEMNVEGYYKTFDNLITMKPGADFFTSTANWEENIAKNGEGKSYGAEFRFEKKTGRLTGWVSYTLSKATRQYDNLNNGEAYPYRYDRRHDFSIVGTYNINEKFSLSMNWVYGTGDAITLPFGHYRSQVGADNEVRVYNERNGYRMRAYHRLDASFSYENNTDWGSSTWSLSFYNAYNRQNPFFYHFKNMDGGGRQLYQTSLFPIVPSVSYNIKF